MERIQSKVEGTATDHTGSKVWMQNKSGLGKFPSIMICRDMRNQTKCADFRLLLKKYLLLFIYTTLERNTHTDYYITVVISTNYSSTVF